jgi:hypothetical protein
MALLGSALWLASLLWLQPPLIVGLLLVGPFLVVPLVLAMVPAPRPGPAWEKPWSVLRLLQAPAAICVAVSFHFGEGAVAALWTLPWLGFAGLVALGGLVRFLAHRGRPLAELAVDAGLAFLAVGGVWLAVSRWGHPVAGFGNPIALLTAAHFNLAGIAVPVLAGLAARRLPGRHASLACFGAISGLPVVAAGITLQAQGVERVNTVAVAYFVAAMLVLALLHARLAVRPGPAVRRFLLGVSAASLPVGMALAMLYASSELTGLVITIETMARTHAVINVFGFALPALAAWWADVPDAAPAVGPRAAAA